MACYENLLIAVAYHGDRWAPSTLAAAAAIPDADELSPSEWAELLDRIEEALSALVTPRASGVHVTPRRFLTH